jgi:WD40 repeat protein
VQGEQLAAEAETLLPRLPHRTTAATTLAIEAQSLSPSIQTDRILRKQLEILPRMRRTMVFLDRVFDVAVSPDGRYVGAGDESGVIKIYDLEEDRLAHVLQAETTLKAIAFAPDGKTFATVHDARTWSLPIKPGFAYEMVVTSSYYSTGPMQQRPPDGKISAGTKVKILADQGSYLRVQAETGVTVSVRADAVNAKRTATLGEAIVWNVRTGERLFSVAHEGDVRSLDFSPNGRFLATASEDKTAKLTEITTRRTIVVEHDSIVTDVAFTPEGERFATSSNKSVKGWVAENGEQAFQVLHGDTVWAIAISPNGELGASIARNGELFVWKVSDGEKVFSVRHPSGAKGVAWRPDGAELAAGAGSVVHIYDAQSWKRVRTLSHSEGLLGSIGVAYGSKGRVMASWGRDSTTRVWDMDGREFVRIAHDHQTSGAVFFPAGSSIVSVGWDGGVRIADLRKLGEAYADWIVSGRDISGLQKLAGGKRGTSVPFLYFFGFVFMSCDYQKSVTQQLSMNFFNLR